MKIKKRTVRFFTENKIKSVDFWEKPCYNKKEEIKMGLGVIINAAAVVLGAAIGTLLKNVLKENTVQTVMQALGLTVLAAGILDVVGGIQSLSDNGFAYGTLFAVLAIVFGGLIGSILHIQDGLERFGAFLQNKLSKSETSTLGKAFVEATLITCIGAMAVYGSIQSGLGNNGTLYIKSLLDGIICMMLASKYGFGAALAAIPIFVIQGAVALIGIFFSEYILNTNFYYLLTAVGGILVIAIGINLLEIKKIRTGDLLPAIFLSLLIYLF